MGILDASDPNFHYGKSATAHAKPFEGIVWHHTREAPLMNMVDYGKRVDPERGGAFGYHYYIGPDGQVVQGAPTDKRTNHIKPGSPTGFSNSNAMGISLVGAEHGATPAQLEAAKRLGKEIEAKYGIPATNNLGHGELQKDRQHHEGGELAGYMRGDDIANDAMRALGKTPMQPDPPKATPRGSMVAQTRSTSPRPTIGSGGTTSLLGSIRNDKMNTEMTEPQMPEKEMVGGMIGKMFPNLTPDRLDRISLALMSLSGYPTPGMESLMQGAQQRIGDRREEKSNQQRNSKTAEMLRSNGAPDYLVQAAMNGYGAEAFSQYMQLKGRNPDKPTPYSDQAKIMSDLRNGLITKEQANAALTGGGSTEADREIARLESVGIPRNIAIKIKEGVYKTTQDPVTREVTVIDISTGQPVYQATGTPAPAPSDILTPAPTPTGADASDSFGLEGMIKRAINSGSDFIGAGTPFEGVRDTQSDFAVLREGLVNDISQGYGRQPPSWLMKNIQDLTPSAGGLQGADDAQSKLGALQRSFAQELQNIDQQMQGQISPTQRQVLTERAASLNAAIGKVDNALTRFGSGGVGTTKSGIKWSVE